MKHIILGSDKVVKRKIKVVVKFMKKTLNDSKIKERRLKI